MLQCTLLRSSISGCSAVALGALLAGCASGTLGPPAGSGGAAPQSHAMGTSANGWASPDARRRKKSLIYWADYDKSKVTIFSARGVNGQQKGIITTGLSNPQRLFVDAARNLYASNISNNTITAYHPSQTSPFLTIGTGVNSPTGLTVDAGGTVYCANVGNDTITEYPLGQTTPSLTITLGANPEYLATDASDNLYATVGTAIYEYAPGSKTGKNLGLNVSAPGALEVDKAGNIILLDRDTLDYFPAGQTQPSKQIKVTGGAPFGLSLSADETTLYVSVNSSSTFVIKDISYPNGTTLANKLTTNAGQWPLAVSPDNALGG